MKAFNGKGMFLTLQVAAAKAEVERLALSILGTGPWVGARPVLPTSLKC